MTQKLRHLLLLIMCFALLSASTTTTEKIPAVTEQAAAPVVAEQGDSKLNFFQRAMLKHANKKALSSKEGEIVADKKAGTSLILGIVSGILLLSAILAPVLIIAAVPTSIIAFTK